MDISKERRQQLLDGAYKLVKANWEEKKQTWLGWRYSMQCAIGLLHSEREEHRAFANGLLLDSGEWPEDISFGANLCMQLLVKHEKKLCPEALEKVRSYTARLAPEEMKVDMDFVGVNDNFPMMATYTTLVGGEYLHDEKAFAVGKRRLTFLYNMLHRRNLLSEYTSRCYSGMSLYHIASIASDVQDPQMKEMAIYCEQQIWNDFAQHYYAPLNMMAGPYSRAYEAATVGAPFDGDTVHYLLLFGIGEIGAFAPYSGTAHLEADARICWFLGTSYHFPEHLMDTMFHKAYPFQVDMTAEIGPSRFHTRSDRLNVQEDHIAVSMEEDCLDEYPAATSFNTTYMEEAFTVGCALRPFHSAAFPESYFAIYPKKGSSRTVFSRYIINDKTVGQINYDPWMDMQSPTTLWDEGRKLCIQDGHTSLVVYKPTYYDHDAVTQLRMSIVIAAKGDTLDQVYIDGKTVSGSYTAEEVRPVFIADGDVYMAFLPLEVTDHGRQQGMRLHYVNGYAELSYYNYDGQVRAFRKNQMLLTANGYVSILRSKKDFACFADFVAAYSHYTLHDATECSGHTRGAHARTVSFQNCDSTFEFSYSPLTEGIRYALTKNKTIV